MRPLFDLFAALAGLYLSALGFTLLWMWQCAATGRDPWITPRSTR